jgi:hypothetical protein
LIYLKPIMANCSKCSEAPKILRLVKCVTCFKPVCEKCVVRRYAKTFCSSDCAKNFFFDLDEDDQSPRNASKG